MRAVYTLMSGKIIEMTDKDLLQAVQFGNLKRVKAGLQQGLDPNYSDDEDGYTLLHWAAQEGYADIIRLLVRHGGDVEAVFQDDMTALYNAAGEGNLEVAKALIECGADVNRTQKSGAALHNAAAHGNQAVVELLIATGANVNAFDEEGQAPLLLAVSNGHVDTAEILISNGAQKRVIDFENLPEEINISSAVLNRYDDKGYAALESVEQVLACVLTLKFEVESQGFDSFYASFSGDLALQIVPALERVGAIHAARIMKKANSLFENGIPPRDREVRIKQFRHVKKIRVKLDDLTHSFYEDKDDLRELLNTFIRENHTQLPNA